MHPRPPGERRASYFFSPPPPTPPPPPPFGSKGKGLIADWQGPVRCRTTIRPPSYAVDYYLEKLRLVGNVWTFPWDSAKNRQQDKETLMITRGICLSFGAWRLHWRFLDKLFRVRARDDSSTMSRGREEQGTMSSGL